MSARNWLWMACPEPWRLQDVQAALNVLITVICGLCIFVFARICWQRATAKVVKSKPVPLPALLSVTSIGEVYDVVMLLGWTLLTSGYLQILAQCLVVCLFAIAAILSGPIARYSSRHGTTLGVVAVAGYVAERNFLSDSFNNVLWNQTETSLNDANFPYDQLLDFLPNTTQPWQYVPQEWNNTWSMNCQLFNRTPITLTVTNENCSVPFPYGQIPGLLPVFDGRNFGGNFSMRNGDWQGNTINTTLTDTLMFLVGWNLGDLQDTTEETMFRSVKYTIVSLHLHNTNDTREKTCEFGRGTMGSASYVKAVCDVQRRSPPTNNPDFNPYYTGMPDFSNSGFHVKALTQYYYARFSREATLKQTVTELTPRDLVRFYQVYEVCRNTQAELSNSRPLTSRLDIVEVSSIFLIVCGLFTLLCIAGLVAFTHFSLRHHKTVDQTPQSKLDWMLHTIQQTRPQNPYGQRGPRYSVTSIRQDSGSTMTPRPDDKRADFETATYAIPTEIYSEPSPYHGPALVTSPPLMSPPASGTSWSSKLRTKNSDYEMLSAHSEGSSSVPSYHTTPVQGHQFQWERSNWDARGSEDDISLLGRTQQVPVDPLYNDNWPASRV